MWYADKHAENIWGFKLNPLKETKQVTMIINKRLHFEVVNRWIKRNATLAKDILIVVITVAILSVCQEGWDDNEASFPNTHTQKTLVHAFNEVTLAQVGVIGGIPRVTK